MAGKTLIKNGTVVTMNDAGDVHFGGSVLLDGDRIADVGPADEVAARHATDGQVTVIDAANKAVLPGLVDLHYHTALGKGWSDHLPLWEYLDTCWYPIIRALDDDAAYWAPRPRRSGSVRCCPTTSPTTSTTWTPWPTTSTPTGPTTARPTAGSRSTSASSGCRWPRRGCCATPGPWPTTWAPGSTST